jgi:hypothetical protein
VKNVASSGNSDEGFRGRELGITASVKESLYISGVVKK